jgi:alanyl-tRNA synthetase
VTDAKPGPGGTIVHDGVVEAGEVHAGEEIHGEVDAERRASTARAHTATHVLHHTLRHFLGEHARQAGSLVAPGRLRFDFTHHSNVPRESLEEVEYLANRRLGDDSPVRAYETTYQFAQAEGAIALFGEKYGDIVRVVEVGDYSVELCGGTHVRHTGEVSLIRLLHEQSIGSGFRRIEALVGPDALQQVNVERRLLEEVAEAVGSGDPAAAPERVRKAVARIKQLESELGKLRRTEQEAEAAALVDGATHIRDVDAWWVTKLFDDVSADGLRELAMAVRNRLAGRAAVAVLGSANDGKALLVASCTNELIARGVTAPAVLETAAKRIGGGAGGKPPLAFAGGPDAGGLDQASAEALHRFEALLRGA